MFGLKLVAFWLNILKRLCVALYTLYFIADTKNR